MSGPDATPPRIIHATFWGRMGGPLVFTGIGLAIGLFGVVRLALGYRTLDDWSLPFTGTGFVVSMFLLESSRAFNTRPRLIICDAGILDHSSRTAVGFVPREEVEAVILFRLAFGDEMLGIRVRDREAMLARMPRNKARRLRAWKWPEGVSFVPRLSETAAKCEELALDIHQRYGVPISVGPNWSKQAEEE